MRGIILGGLLAMVAALVILAVRADFGLAWTELAWLALRGLGVVVLAGMAGSLVGGVVEMYMTWRQLHRGHGHHSMSH